MKKLIIIAAMFATLNGCKKCRDCTTTTTTSCYPSVAGFPQTTSTTSELCGDDLKEADGKTSTVKTKTGSYTLTAVSKCNCN